MPIEAIPMEGRTVLKVVCSFSYDARSIICHFLLILANLAMSNFFSSLVTFHFTKPQLGNCVIQAAKAKPITEQYKDYTLGNTN